MLRSDAVQRQIRQKTYGAALQQINISDLRKIMISFPSSDKTQTELAGFLQATREDSGKLLNIYTQKQRKLAELKKSLLSAAFNGDL
jgi:restriction endonuclease S subunit